MATDRISLLTDEWTRAKLGAEDYLQAMPDDKVSFRPVPEVLTFAGQFLHLADANFMFAAAAAGVENSNAAAMAAGVKSENKPELQTKPGLLGYVLGSYDFIIDSVKRLDATALDEDVTFFRWTMPRHVLLAKAMEHHAHHRGQTAIYFRLQGMAPPSERLF